MYYVNARWLGGMLTNFTHHAYPHRASERSCAQMEEDGTFDHAAQEGSHQACSGEIDKLEKYPGRHQET